jgi:hypothetical protein
MRQFGRKREAFYSLLLILVGQVGQLGQALKIPRLLASNLAACARTGGPEHSLVLAAAKTGKVVELRS